MRTRWLNAACKVVGGAMLAGTVAACGHSISTSGGPPPPAKGGPQFLYVTNNADSVLSEFTVDAAKGFLTLFGQVPVGNGAGAAGLAGTIKGKFLFVLNSQSSQIFCFNINEKTGALTPTAQATVSTGAGTQPISIVLDDTSTFLYVADQANDQIFQYFVDKKTGELSALVPPTVSTAPPHSVIAQRPVSITFSPFGNAIFVANQAVGTIAAFSRAKTGQLTQTGFAPSLNSPNVPSNGIPEWIQADPNTGFLYDADAGTTAPNGTPGGEVSLFTVSGAQLAFQGAFSTQNNTGFPVALFVDPVLPFVYTANDGQNNATVYTINAAGLTQGVKQNGFVSLGNVTTDQTGGFFYGLDTSNGRVFEGAINSSTGGVTTIPPGAVDTENPSNPGSKPFQGVVVQTPKSGH